MATAADTLSTYEAIAAAGVDDGAARAISKAIDQSRRDVESGLVTKVDFNTLSAKMESEFALMRGELKAASADTGRQIAESRADVLKTLYASIAIVAALSSTLAVLGTYLVNHVLPAAVH